MFGISDERPRLVVGSKAFDQPERTRKGLIDKLKIMVDFQLYEYQGKRVLVFEVNRKSGYNILAVVEVSQPGQHLFPACRDDGENHNIRFWKRQRTDT